MSDFPAGTSFLFVGHLATMTKDQARALVLEQGGVCPSAVSEELDYLVVGDEGSPFYGGEKKPKQVKAEAMIEAGARIAIISEADFLRLTGEQSQPAERVEDFGLSPADRPKPAGPANR
jgi:BRCT domain type II-containing protein